MKYTSTICPFCGAGCNLYLETKDNCVLGVYPSRNASLNRGRLCVKGWNAFEFVHHPDRLKRPLIKKNGRFVETSWADAYRLIVHKIKEIKSKYSPDAFAVISSARCTNEENFLTQKFARVCLQTNNIDHCARTCHSPSVAGLTRSFGSGAATNSINELDNARCIFITGSNTFEAHPVIGWHIITAKDRGAKIILADPRNIGLSNFADVHLRLLPGTDIALLNGLMYIILKEGLDDKNFVQARTEGFSAFKEVIDKYPPDTVEKITRVPKDLLIKAARMYGAVKPASICYSLGITEHITGTDNVSSLANLAMLTGNVGKLSSGVNPLRGQNNVQGACDMGALPNVLSGYQAVDNSAVRERFEKAWQVKLPEKKGFTITEMFSEPGRIKFFYIAGEDVAHTEPNSSHVVSALNKAEFVVVCDLFFCETAGYADVVLPAASFAEKEGTFTNADRRVQRVRKAIEPLKGTKTDAEIIIELANLLGYPFGYKSSSRIMDEIASLTPVYAGISYERLESEGFLQWPCPDLKHKGTALLHKHRFTSGKGKFFAIEHKPAAELPDGEFPFILSTGRMLFQYNSGTQTRRTAILSREFPENFVQINSQDALRLGIKHRSKVRVSTRRGSLVITAQASGDILPGVIWMPFHYADKLTNILTNNAFDPISKIGEYKVCAAKIEREC